MEPVIPWLVLLTIPGRLIVQPLAYFGIVRFGDATGNESGSVSMFLWSAVLSAFIYAGAAVLCLS